MVYVVELVTASGVVTKAYGTDLVVGGHVVAVASQAEGACAWGVVSLTMAVGSVFVEGVHELMVGSDGREVAST